MYFSKFYFKIDKMSLLEDCQNCLLKGHESWKLYFSKWELLAKEEENIPEEELLNLSEDIIMEPEKQSISSKFVCKNRSKGKKRAKKINMKKNKVCKKKKNLEIIKQPNAVGNENKMEDLGNEQLELDLRTIFMDILKANKNKWEIFSVLSQTFSQGNITIKSSHHLVLNQQLALPFNDNRMALSPVNQVFSSAVSHINQNMFEQPRNFSLYNSPSGKTQYHFYSERLFGSRNQLLNSRYSGNEFGCEISQMRALTYGAQSPQNISRTEFMFRNRFTRSCPSKVFSNNFSNQRSMVLKPSALDFNNKYQSSDSVDKVFGETRFKQPYFERGSMNICQEKSFQNLSSHKRTNDMSLNMENSNFITPKRKASERKCLSENILQRKRKRPSKLAFFDNEEDSESDDDRSVHRSPIIIWENKRRKTEIIPEKVEGESDSDDCEKILDRVIKP